jgi:putative copper export protein
VLSVDSTTIRLFLHVLGASVWVGGQLTLAALVPTLRSRDAELPRYVARRFNQMAWPAFALLIATGVWNAVAERSSLHGDYETTFIVKMVAVAVSGIAAFVHTQARTRSTVALTGAVSGSAALAALLLGVMLAG